MANLWCVVCSFEMNWLNCRGKLELKTDTRLAGNYAVTPPAPLTQDYYKCRYTEGKVLQDSLSK
jgi:hypothetical protein